MSAITQSPDFAVAPQKADDKLAASPQLIATAVDESNKTENTLQQQTQQNYQQVQQSGEKDELGREQLEKMAQQLQDFMGEMNRSLQFQVDEESGRDVIRVVDKNSGELIKQYPSEEVLSLVAKLSETAGFLIDQKA
ncbi:flagellar protein FlaG [Pseudoalteromonas sp. ACER1]|uniref:flagellar protein FlaG n=1 Tax=unclassified Pseudoalteromonas TaxID=194690 RepID=UPI001F41789C|nr:MULTISPECIES: flagellar protein FlaG [unclassified Pseudoalteromonas]MCF2847162.1 flagellar protein FlaG [Pseudoalteromonas sp. PAST1]MCO7210892.1 flagellar protein FlaG [Pseudoalteromonas sp. ACER1]|tara:strand:- start:44 stop:454 length:411 start_codon:yes stop_codon:yes gene_type:complete